MFFANTPKALANVSPGFEEREPWDITSKIDLTLKGFANRRTLSGLRRDLKIMSQGSRSSNPGLTLANAFGVIFQT